MSKTPAFQLNVNQILPSLRVDSKKQALIEIARLAAPTTGLGEHDIFDVLFAREKLATTGVGQGIAIPHGKINNLDKVYGFFARLEQPIDFQAIDDRPVDLMFMLLAPHDAGADHLKALARVSRMFREPSFAEKLRGSRDAKTIHAMFTAYSKETDAAA